MSAFKLLKDPHMLWEAEGQEALCGGQKGLCDLSQVPAHSGLYTSFCKQTTMEWTFY